MRIALSIAGSDPTGGAGLQADLQVFHAFGVHGAAAPTALTVQEPTRVHQVLPVFPSVMLAQLRTLFGALRPHAIKLGMLGSDEVLRAVALALEGFGAQLPPLVIDPVLAASDGTPLLEPRALPALRELAARATLLTPNRAEAEALGSQPLSARATRAEVEAAAGALLESGAKAVLLKGGHAEDNADDCLVARRPDGRTEITWLTGERIGGPPIHGTGCALSAAITAGLASGKELRAAVTEARAFVRGAIAGGGSLLNFAGTQARSARRREARPRNASQPASEHAD